MDIKQVIVYRRDLKMRKGKIAAQVAHASMKVFFDRMVVPVDPESVPLSLRNDVRRWQDDKVLVMPVTEEMWTWATELFGKIVLSVENEADLLRVHELAQEAGIPTALITDAGRTEFKKECPDCNGNGFTEWMTGCPECGATPPCEPPDECPGPDEVCGTCSGSGKVPNPTHTTVALGPAKAEDIDKITGPEGAVECKLA